MADRGNNRTVMAPLVIIIEANIGAIISLSFTLSVTTTITGNPEAE